LEKGKAFDFSKDSRIIAFDWEGEVSKRRRDRCRDHTGDNRRVSINYGAPRAASVAINWSVNLR